jgi:hypothetical protein
MLTPAQRKWFLLEQILLPTFFNFAFNAFLGWLVFRAVVPVPLWFSPSAWADLLKPSLGGDLLGMLFFLPGCTVIIGTPLIQRAARLGKIERLPIGPAQHWLLRHMPRGLILRACFVGFWCVALLGPLTLGSLALLGMHAWSLHAAVVFKGIYAGLLAGLVTPPIAAYALLRFESEPATAWHYLMGRG